MSSAVAEHDAPSVPPADPRGRPLAAQLREIQTLCGELSAQHRLALPPDLVRSRMHALAARGSELFSDRVIEICFLLDQYGTLRYNELRRMLGIISTRTLANRLAFLHREGLVVRTLFVENPPRVEYRLSTRGKEFTQLLFPALLHVARPEGRP